MKKLAFESVIFDMDGTLLDSSFAMLQSVNFVRNTLNLGDITKEFLEYHINEPDQDLPMLFYGTPQYVPQHREMFKNHYLQNANAHVQVYDGVYELLEFLKASHVSMSIATNASDFFAHNMLQDKNLLGYFSHIVGANCVQNPKPNPDMIHHIANLSNIPLSKTLFVGDSVKDELAAKNAGIEFLFAAWGYGASHFESKKYKSVQEMLAFIKTKTTL